MNNRGNIIRTDPYKEAVTGDTVVSNALTFTDKNGKIRGVMAIDLSSDKLVGIMNDIKIGKTGYAMMLHKTGLILADPKNPKNCNKYIKDIENSNFAKITDEKTQVSPPQ